MIKKVEVLISFPMGAKFRENLDLSIYRKLMNFIYDLSCFNSMTKCNECSQCRECRYYLMTGENFRFYPGILVKSDIFGKSHFGKNEQKRFEFYFIGNNKSYSDYVDLLFSNLNQSLFGNFFYLIKITKTDLNSNNMNCDKLVFSTPLEGKNVSEVYNKM